MKYFEATDPYADPHGSTLRLCFGFMALSPDPYADPHGRPFVVMLQRASFICIFHAGSVMSLLNTYLPLLLFAGNGSACGSA